MEFSLFQSFFYYFRYVDDKIILMELDPHTLQQIIQRIYQQMRCPQCGKRVPVDFTSVRMAADDFMLLQLKCETCDAYIVLHASLQGTDVAAKPVTEESTVNASSSLSLKDDEVSMLHDALEECGGSFDQLFTKYGANEDVEIEIDVDSDTDSSIDSRIV